MESLETLRNIEKELSMIDGSISDIKKERSDEIHRLQMEYDELERRLKELKQPKGKIRRKMYIHGDRETHYEIGEELGLVGEALNNFSWSFYEVELDVEINCETGDVKVLKFDGVEVSI